ncbi:Rieske (2Fe-2S) protein [Kaistia dalseonensis]|uniref:Nitrite reductase/ring-hydroxylating ferredoxin subunit n=1 Tax=Kaistia dalseonensis TaxID=410840 RepID=A0ABU0HCK6_9HYPH|nr:Rieske (2Fe-2S) protein [Kaistia dalseonensis]MCX5497409.1 Rieske (2Fe-2S) protein [Kaistia dalseonensis]MDQ0440048.1 nitrite reductase/ring-hydroxylating ferredoxin subunit [Kaistia dalseonensis]
MSFSAGWYAVAIAGGLEPGTSAGTRLFDKELVIWRDKDGASHAWEDRCPHRGMRLSFGFVRGNHIACLYHGWQFDEAGQCRYIPAHPKLDVPDTIKVARYPSVEAKGLIWVYSEMVAEAPVPAPEDGAATPVRSLYLERDPATVGFIIENGGAGPFEILSDSLFATNVEGAELLVALQPFTDDRTALHIVITSGDIAPAKIAVWAEELRAVLETVRPISSGDALLAERFAS